MKHPKVSQIDELLAELFADGIEFIVIGGAAAVLLGAPITTQDLDIVHRRSPENIDRLIKTLERLDATFRFDLTDRKLRPTTGDLGGKGHLNLSTRLGPLDSLCQIDDGSGYDELLPCSLLMTDEKLQLRVLRLDTLIQIKQRVGREKDKLVLPILLAMQRRQKR